MRENGFNVDICNSKDELVRKKIMICIHLDKVGLIARVIYLVLKNWVNKALLDPLTKVINLLIFIHILCNEKLHAALLELRIEYQLNNLF